MKILLVSDTHLSPQANDFNQNWQLVAGWVKNSGADLTIHLGDISAAGNEQVADLLFAKELLAQFASPLHLVPGNHDLGDNISQMKASNHEVISAQSLQRYREVFGQDYWSLQLDGWLLIGLNAQLFGSAGQEEQYMFDWLQRVLALQDDNEQLKRQPVGVFLHKPLFRQQPNEEDSSDRYVPKQAREQLLRILAPYDLRFVISGHTHQYRRIQVAGVEHIWMPSTAFCIPDAVQEPIGQKIVGVMLLTLDANKHHAVMVNIDGMQRHNLLDQTTVYLQLIGLKDKLGAEGEL
jgi:3',5'-cyclic AMP phosphodiesterase CpdA